MKSETGIPEWDGLYVVYVDGKDGGLEPFMTVWQDGAWRYRRSTAKFDGTIYYWMGPLPEMKKPGKPKVEFDL